MFTQSAKTKYLEALHGNLLAIDVTASFTEISNLAPSKLRPAAQQMALAIGTTSRFMEDNKTASDTETYKFIGVVSSSVTGPAEKSPTVVESKFCMAMPQYCSVH